MNDKNSQSGLDHGLKFYIDEDGCPAASGEDQRLAVYLQTDIQGSTEIAKELLALLNDSDHRGDFTGNGHTLSIRENSVMIEAMFDDDAPDRCLSRAEMQQALQDWQVFIAKAN